MSIRTATPYLILNGKVDRALALYERALGARAECIQRFGDVDGSCPAAQKARVMHAEARIGEAVVMMSDGPADDGPTSGGNVSVAVNFDDAAQMQRCFDALAETGAVIQPIFAAPWGALFGVVRDEFEIHWMFNCATAAA